MSTKVLQVTRGAEGNTEADAILQFVGELQAKQAPAAKHWLIDSRAFNFMVYSAIFLNTLTMGVQKDLDGEPWDMIWEVSEHVFTALFTVEMVCKLAVLRLKYFKDPWNRMDCTLVTFSIFDLWLIPAFTGGKTGLGVLKVLRIARVARIMKVFKELWMILKGIVDSLKPMFWVSMLLVMLLYLCSIVCAIFVAEGADKVWPGTTNATESVFHTNEELVGWNNYQYFGGIVRAMFTMFAVTIGVEFWELVRPIFCQQPHLLPFFIIFVIFTAFGVMNVLIGVIVDNTMEASKTIDKEAKQAEQKARMEDLQRIQDAVFTLDVDKSGSVSLEELKEGFHSDAVQDVILRARLPHGFGPEDVMMLLDNNHNGELHVDEVHRAFRRLLEGDDFQQSCQIQCSVNEAKRYIRSYRDTARDRIKKLRSKLNDLELALERAQRGGILDEDDEEGEEHGHFSRQTSRQSQR